MLVYQPLAPVCHRAYTRGYQLISYILHLHRKPPPCCDYYFLSLLLSLPRSTLAIYTSRESKKMSAGVTKPVGVLPLAFALVL